MDLKGKIALVTGGGRRLGWAITEALADAGCAMVIHYGRSRQEAEAAAEKLRERGTEVTCVAADLTEDSQIAAMFRTIEAKLGRLDVLVNSAASFEKAALSQIAGADWDRVMSINLRAPFRCVQEAAPLMRASWREEQTPAVVVNIGDLSGVVPWPGYAHHGVSKAGLLHLTRIAARELAPGIRLNAVVPGAVLPPPGVGTEDSSWRTLIDRLPAARRGWPAEVGQTVVFLARNDFVWGEVVCVDGGEHLLGAGHRDL